VGICKEHLAKIAELMEEKGVACYYREQKETRLDFSGAFRDSVLAKLGIAPELSRAEPMAVEHLGGYSFFGLLVAAGAVSPSLTLLYRSAKDDFHVYACVEEGRMRFFVVRQEGVGRRWEAE